MVEFRHPSKLHSDCTKKAVLISCIVLIPFPMCWSRFLLSRGKRGDLYALSQFYAFVVKKHC
jgi:hypothetical protein